MQQADMTATDQRVAHSGGFVPDTGIVARDCPACGHDNALRLPLSYSADAWPMKQCRRCDMVYLELGRALDALYETHAWEVTAAAEDQRRAARFGLARRVSKRLQHWRNRCLPRKQAAELVARYASFGPVLDVGASQGMHLLSLPPHYIPHGVEISSQAVRQGREAVEARGGSLINADACTGMQHFPQDFFTAIMMRSFLEHDLTPQATLAQARRVLAPGGILVIKVPNYACLNRKLMGSDWCGFRFPDHLNYFTPATLVALLRDHGFEARRFAWHDRLPISDNMWCVAICF